LKEKNKRDFKQNRRAGSVRDPGRRKGSLKGIKMNLLAEERKATRLLKAKKIESIKRSRRSEVMISFTDGTLFYIDLVGKGLDLSIVSGPKKEKRKKAGFAIAGKKDRKKANKRGRIAQ